MLRYVSIIALLYFSASAMAHDSGGEFLAQENACQKKLSTKVPRGFMKREILNHPALAGMEDWSPEEIQDYLASHEGSPQPRVVHTPPPQWEHALPGGYRPNWPPQEKP